MIDHCTPKTYLLLSEPINYATYFKAQIGARLGSSLGQVVHYTKNNILLLNKFKQVLNTGLLFLAKNKTIWQKAWL